MFRGLGRYRLQQKRINRIVVVQILHPLKAVQVQDAILIMKMILTTEVVVMEEIVVVEVVEVEVEAVEVEETKKITATNNEAFTVAESQAMKPMAGG